MLLTSDLAVLDHWDGSVLLIANAINHNDLDTGVDEAYADAVARLDAMEADLAKPVEYAPVALPASELPEYTALWGGPRLPGRRRGHQGAHPGRRGLPGGALAALRNPVRGERAGRLPGAAGHQPVARTCTCSASTASTSSAPAPRRWSRSRTGGRWSTRSPGPGRAAPPRSDDQALADELLADPKERAEHLMLVDLGRNDLGRVCEPGSVEVVDFMSVERYSHVMHIVSTVTGRVAEGRTAFDVLTACFPAGTLSGAPKPRAMQIIEELEPSRRGLYGGCVGYLDFAGDSDTAIAIRTALLRDGTAYVQAGAGVVADSDPVAEDNECRNKAAAVLRAVNTANSAQPVNAAVPFGVPSPDGPS